MCGYDPFYWYEKDLDDEYVQRMGINNERVQDGFKTTHRQRISDKADRFNRNERFATF